MSNIERAIEIAISAHKNQSDKAGKPYLLHPLRLMLKMRTDAEMIAAVLHDVVEDSAWTLDDLRSEGFSEEIVAAVDHLTRREGQTYEDYVERAAGNRIACRIKIADLEDNLDATRLQEFSDSTIRRFEKYLKAWRFLTHNVENDSSKA